MAVNIYVGDKQIMIGKARLSVKIIKVLNMTIYEFNPFSSRFILSVCVMNEHNNSQTYGSKFLKNVNGSFYCVNPLCPLLSQARSTQVSDRLSDLAICVSGLSTLIFGETLPQFNHKLSGSNADKFTTNAADFLSTKQGQTQLSSTGSDIEHFLKEGGAIICG
ncbi:uncharacterized protein EV154DRAFT_477801 [Mucor mucedo]|uniref:uncharacterized protein n=1 Tax=Mucor mucedo TaxID=29922 RepID=UPI00222081ED|nr:uncharacterized protein EV154DRAFT_477801 [Mucor mucedo]KAI7895025.1 hypothetical protein EV154DRAFT_477801 [Mucor mucedo]